MTISTAPATVPKQPPLPARWRRGLALTFVAVAALLAWTEPPDYVDSFHYALHIVEHGQMAPQADPFWDFGHVLWRPLGAAVMSVARAPLADWFGGNRLFMAAGSLIAISAVCTLFCAVVMYLLLLRLTNSNWIAGITTVAFIASRAVLDYALTGISYCPGIALQIAGLYLLLPAVTENRLRAGRALLGGCLFGLSVCLWFPFSFSIPGFLALLLLWGRDRTQFRAVLRFVIVAVAGMVLTMGAVYGAVMAAAHVTSLQALRAWIERSRYGIKPTRGVLRTAFAIPRSFFWMGDDGPLFKRFLFDPAHRPPVSQILASGWWKLVIVYGVLLAAARALAKFAAGRSLLAALLVTAAPMLYFAIFLFDPAPPIRYVAMFPLLYVGFALLMVAGETRVFRTVLPAFFLVLLTVNAAGLSRLEGSSRFPEARQRLTELNPYLRANDRIFILDLQDNINRYMAFRPFDAASRFSNSFEPIVPLQTDYVSQWRSRFASEALKTWGAGGHVWVTRRILASSPHADWSWVEGDDPRVRWPGIQAFFNQFDLQGGPPGEDGFAELVQDGRDQAALQSAAAQ